MTDSCRNPRPATVAAPIRQQFVFLLAARVLGAAVQAGMLIYLARVVSLSEFGVLNAVLAIGVVVFAAADFGASTAVVKFGAAGDQALVGGLVRLSRLTSVVAGAAYSLVVLALGLHLGWTWGVAFIGVAMALEKNVDFLLGISIAAGDKAAPAVSVVLRRLSALASFALLVQIQAPVTAFCLAALFASVAGQVHQQHVLGSFAKPAGKPPIGLWSAVRVCRPYFVSNVSAQSRSLDVPVVGLCAGAAVAGLYAGATKITNPFLLLPSVLTTLLMPHAVRSTPTATVRTARRLCLASAGFLIVLGVVAPFSGELASLVLGPAFGDAGPTLAWALLALAPVALAPPLGSILQSRGYVLLVAVNGTVFAVLTLLLVAAGALAFGASGAAAGVAVSYTLKCVALICAVELRVRTPRQRTTDQPTEVS